MRRRDKTSRVSHERWLVSYADFITLLFAFFVVLYAFARADEKKQAQIPVAIDSAFHAMAIFPGKTSDSGASRVAAAATGIVTSEQVRVPAEVKWDLERIERDLSQKLSDQIAAHSISMAIGRDGLVISLREAGFFNSGSATAKPEGIAPLRKIAISLSQVPYDVRVEGHTDDVPIHNSAFDSNWELSSARATGIARLFLEWHTITPERLSAAGYGEFHPLASNATAEGRAQNRRVDLVVMPRTSIDFSPPSAATSSGPWRRITEDDLPVLAADPSDE